MTKRFALVAMLTLALTMMMAGVAMAATNDAGFIPATAGVNVHYGYSSTSTKCSVCHAVHNAERTASAVSEVLLKDTVGNACASCHLDGSATPVDVYGGAAVNYTAVNRYNHSGTENATCTGCHAVHGANVVTANVFSAVGDYILKADIATVPSVGGDTLGSMDAGNDVDYVLSTYCSQCHPYYETDYDTTASEQHHIMTADITGYANTDAHYTGDVAAANSAHCFTCHDYNDLANGFPHWTNVAGTATGERFMNVADFYGDTPVPANDTNGNAADDGACLKCHAWESNVGVSGYDSGVGFDF